MVEPTATVDSITVEVIRHRLLSASQEMMRNLQRTAHSTIVYEIRDFGLGIYDAQGALLAEAPGLAIFTRANDYSLEKAIEFLGTDNIEPGDCILLNYPYWSSAHTLDVAAFSPIHAPDGELLGFTATRIHWLDLKQKDAGYVLDSTDMHQEGIFFPCTKIERRGVIQQDIVNLILFNSRYPEQTVGDMRAQIAACRTGERRVNEIVERFGVDVFKAACTQIQDHGERLARAGLRKLPKGTWTAHDFVDDDGIDDRLVRMECTVTISEDEMLVDWSASDPQVKGPINLPYGMTLALSSLIFKALTTPDTPATAGNFRPLRVIAPEGNLMHASPPAPTFTLWTGLLAGEVITKALAQGMPDLVPACSGGDVCSMMGLGLDPRTGRHWLEATNEAVGFGGHVGGDGESGIMHLSEPGCRNNPVEVLEVKSPMLIEHYGLRPDSGGPGEHRGGLGVSRIYRFTAPSTAITLVKKTRTRPWGMEGGETGDNCHVILRPGTDAERVTGGVYESMGADEVLVNNSGGGGGWGDPFRRSVTAVLEDVREGYVTPDRARIDYGVVVDVTAMAVDETATAALRAGRGAQA